MSEIKQWLEGLGLGQYGDAFDENAIDLDLLPDLEDGDLEKMGVAALGHRKKILRAITQPSEPTTAPARQAERRQLTVMFCDLVGSTALSRELDPEDLRDVMRRYQDAVAGAITRYGGHVAKYLGDGVLAYFGWPQAYEDQASRAVYASRDAITAVGAVYISEDRPLEARVGIATGQVVVGDLVGESGSDFEAVTGETPNLAARLQSIATPGQIVIGADTHHLVQQNFTFEELGGHELKGFDTPIQAWGIIGEVSAESRFEASHEAALTRLVGRDEEIRLITDRWQRAVRGNSQTVIMSGEAGIGKSRLMQAISDQIATDDHFRMQYQCSPYHANSALYPVIQQLQREAGFEISDSADSKLDKIEALLHQAGCDVAMDAPYLAHLLSLPYEDRYGAIEQSPQQIKRRQFTVLLGYLRGLASGSALLFLFEDCHWIDPTSQEFLEVCIDELRDLPVLMIVTHRPEWLPPFTDEPHIAFIHLRRLDKACGSDIVREIAGEFISDEAVARIVARTDGVPLFIEELTKSLVEGGFDIENADIPQTLQASLLARLDRLGPEAKEICQIGAVIGREFSHSLVAQVSAKSDQALEIATGRLIQSALVTRRGELPNCTYTFKHALIQDAAYDSLLRARRQDLHRTIAENLVAPDSNLGIEPEVIARHFSFGEVPDQAALFWSRAGATAGEQSADREAVAHAEKGLEQVAKMTAGPASERIELELNLILGPALMNLTSYSSPEVKQAYTRARELGERVGEPHQLFAMQFGWWVVNQMPGQYVAAKEIAAELQQLAEAQSDRGFLLQAHHANWTTLAALSELESCLRHANEGVRLYDIDAHRLHAFKYAGHDPGVCAWDHQALMNWLLGYPDRAAESSKSARALADALDNPSSQVLSLLFSTWIHQYRREPEAVLQYADATIDICDSQNILPNPRAAASIMKLWAQSVLDPSMDLIPAMHDSIGTWEKTGRDLGRISHYQSILAELYAKAGRIDEGLAIIEDAFENAVGAGRLRLDAALFGEKGKLLLARPTPNAEEAEQCLESALQLSQRIGAHSLELRAATTLAKRWHHQGKTADARDLLEPVYAWFTEGFDTQDLIDAKALLANLD